MANVKFAVCFDAGLGEALKNEPELLNSGLFLDEIKKRTVIREVRDEEEKETYLMALDDNDTKYVVLPSEAIEKLK